MYSITGENFFFFLKASVLGFAKNYISSRERELFWLDNSRERGRCIVSRRASRVWEFELVYMYRRSARETRRGMSSARCREIFFDRSDFFFITNIYTV